MAFTGHTPESLIPRSDSRNPATTCKGITTSGRPCRRSIGAAKQNSGVLAVASVVSDSSDDDTEAAAYFCWQHKDQAEQLVAANATAPQKQNTRLYPLQERNSIDTLVAKLGVLDVEESVEEPRRKRRESRQDERGSSKPHRRVNRPPTWDRVQGPLMTVPSDLIAQQTQSQPRRDTNRPPPRRKSSFWASFCCGGSPDDDYVEVVRHKRRTQSSAPPAINELASQPQMSQTPQRVSQAQSGRPSGASRPSSTSQRRPTSAIPERKALGDKQAKALNLASNAQPSATSNLLSYIPKHLTPQTTSLLLAELSKPISPHDDEGYIYIFWLTDESAGPPPSSTASSLLVPPSRPDQGRRTSDVLRQYSVKSPHRPAPPRMRSGASGNSDTEKKTILLKIGRASNVHRRMTEWTRQCGYSLSLVRWYPYVSSNSPSPSPHASPAHSRRQSYQNSPNGPTRRASEGVRKVPHAHRVERLIHIEIAEQRVKKNCEACGKEHREWFEVEATRDGVKGIDDVVKRWVEWAERAGNS